MVWAGRCVLKENLKKEVGKRNVQKNAAMMIKATIVTLERRYTPYQYI